MPGNKYLEADDTGERVEGLEPKVRGLFDFLVISKSNSLYSMFQITLTCIAIVSSFMYCFFAAFRYDREEHGFTDFQSIGLSQKTVRNLDLLDLIFEIFYAIDFGMQFFVEYEAKEPSTHIVREISKTSMRYYRNEMIYDLIPLVPLNRIFKFKYSRLLYFIKCIRIFKTFNLLDT